MCERALATVDLIVGHRWSVTSALVGLVSFVLDRATGCGCGGGPASRAALGALHARGGPPPRGALRAGACQEAPGRGGTKVRRRTPKRIHLISDDNLLTNS